ncbi:copper amine oxidase domain-containing protein [Rhodoplanes sp. Z2-YC6860]|nr:copper amine oxidase domain-containing protein [Rhodoplanes sp. Z2-YC6860]
MMMGFFVRTSAALVGIAIAAGAAAAESNVTVRTYSSDDTLLRLGVFPFEGGKTLNLSVGIGSAAFHHPKDPPNVIWTLGDRGPNIACSDIKEFTGVELGCREIKGSRVYPTPSYAPSIYRVMLLDDGTFQVTDVIKLKDRDGRPLNGMPNPTKTATTETPLDGKGKTLQQDLRGIDAESLVRLNDGTFWVGDENAPSLAHFAADGKLIERHVPKGTEGEFAAAPYKTVGSLPAILAKRQSNRGIEAIGVSPDERFLYLTMQSPLANPDTATFQQARNTRIIKFNRKTMKVLGEYVYSMDDPSTFRRDPSNKPSDPRISEMMAIGVDRLVILERTEGTTKLYEVELAGATNISGTPWDDIATKPSLEQTDVAAAKITPVKKTLRFDTADHNEIVGKTEGMTLLSDGALLLINDDDFGISGARTQIVVVRGTEIKRH